jgi:hypothetical protein
MAAASSRETFAGFAEGERRPLSGLMFCPADALQRPEPDGASGKERR